MSTRRRPVVLEGVRDRLRRLADHLLARSLPTAGPVIRAATPGYPVDRTRGGR